jgi:hypothetical protein
MALVALLGGGLWIGNLYLDRWLYPWADASGGRPVLMGTWVGQLTTGGGRPRAVLMELVREQPSPSSDRPCRGCDDGIEGTAVTCDERGRVWRYHVSGTPDDRHATRLLAGTQPVTVPRPDGLSMSAVRGGWDGADALDLEAEFAWHRGTSSISSTADPDTRDWVPLPMRRGVEADFRARCRRILGRAIPEVVP